MIGIDKDDWVRDRDRDRDKVRVRVRVSGRNFTLCEDMGIE